MLDGREGTEGQAFRRAVAFVTNDERNRLVVDDGDDRRVETDADRRGLAARRVGGHRRFLVEGLAVSAF